LTKGRAAFVLPLRQNIAYIEIEPGDTVGTVDIAVNANIENESVSALIQNLNKYQDRLERQFTV